MKEWGKGGKGVWEGTLIPSFGIYVDSCKTNWDKEYTREKRRGERLMSVKKRESSEIYPTCELSLLS